MAGDRAPLEFSHYLPPDAGHDTGPLATLQHACFSWSPRHPLACLLKASPQKHLAEHRAACAPQATWMKNIPFVPQRMARGAISWTAAFIFIFWRTLELSLGMSLDKIPWGSSDFSRKLVNALGGRRKTNTVYQKPFRSNVKNSGLKRLAWPLAPFLPSLTLPPLPPLSQIFWGFTVGL